MAFMKLFSWSPEKDAETMVWLAESDEITNHDDLYYADKKVAIPSLAAQDWDVARSLWQVSEEQTKVQEPRKRFKKILKFKRFLSAIFYKIIYYRVINLLIRLNQSKNYIMEVGDHRCYKQNIASKKTF